jgi:hypothetical protein
VILVDIHRMYFRKKIKIIFWNSIHSMLLLLPRWIILISNFDLGRKNEPLHTCYQMELVFVESHDLVELLHFNHIANNCISYCLFEGRLPWSHHFICTFLHNSHHMKAWLKFNLRYYSTSRVGQQCRVLLWVRDQTFPSIF